MSRPIFVVDAFASGPFRGNPAAVVLLEAGDTPGVAWMQSVAAEMKHSETAYVQPRADGECRSSHGCLDRQVPAAADDDIPSRRG